MIDRRQFLGAVAALGGAAISSSPINLLAASESAAGGGGDNINSMPDSTQNPAGGYLETSNGWYTHNGKAIWGAAHHNQWWGGLRVPPTGWWTDVDLSPSLIRNAPGKVGLNLTEDLDPLTDSMVNHGFPGLEHTPPLWYDRRRDAHDTTRRLDDKVIGPVFEMPWARSNQGQAWDGLPLYDLTKFNDWYFDRLKKFADLCDRKGCVLFYNGYHQHNLLETQAHYTDYPWRPANCIQETGLPDIIPAANAFYDLTSPVRRDLHKQLIWHSLDVLGNNRNVVFLTGMEFTGPLTFMQFWLDTIFDWEKQAGRKVHIGLGATKDVTDAILADQKYGPRIGTIDVRYWHCEPDGTLDAPKGGEEVPGRYMGQSRANPLQVYKQVREYRLHYPDKAIVNLLNADQERTMAFFMAGGSMLIRGMGYAREYPKTYEMPTGQESILPIYEFIRNHISSDLLQMQPIDATDKPDTVWCLGKKGESYLIYMPFGNQWFNLDLSDAPGTYDAKWMGMNLGTVFTAIGPIYAGPESERIRAYGGTVQGGGLLELSGLDLRPWMLWLKRRA